MKLSENLASIAPSVTLQITAKAKELKEQGEDVLGFAAGEPDFDTPDFIKDAAIKALKDGFTRYTPAAGTIPLKEAIAKKLKKDNGIDYDPSQIIVSSGAKHSLYNTFKALLNPGDEVIIPAPFWLSYPEMVKSVGGKAVIIDTTMESKFRITAAELKEKINPKTKAVVLNSPSNPTGSLYTKEELEAIRKVVVDSGIYVISDEIYEKLIYDNAQFVSIASLGEDIKERTITINGMSKAYAMTGWRLGYLAAPKDVAKMINAFQSHSTSNPTSFAQSGGLEALTNPETEKAVATMVAAYSKRREMMYSALEAIPKIKPLKPDGAFYIFCDISETGLSSLDFASKLLEDKKVAIVPGAAFGADNCIRLSFATSEEIIQKGLERIGSWIAEN